MFFKLESDALLSQSNSVCAAVIWFDHLRVFILVGSEIIDSIPPPPLSFDTVYNKSNILNQTGEGGDQATVGGEG